MKCTVMTDDNHSGKKSILRNMRMDTLFCMWITSDAVYLGIFTCQMRWLDHSCLFWTNLHKGIGSLSAGTNNDIPRQKQLNYSTTFNGFPPYSTLMIIFKLFLLTSRPSKNKTTIVRDSRNKSWQLTGKLVSHQKSVKESVTRRSSKDADDDRQWPCHCNCTYACCSSAPACLLALKLLWYIFVCSK